MQVLDDYEHVEGDHGDYEDADDADVVHLLPAVRRQVEGEHCEEGDAHAGDDQVHLHITQNPPEAS